MYEYSSTAVLNLVRARMHQDSTAANVAIVLVGLTDGSTITSTVEDTVVVEDSS